jgi:hypothetical protein
MKLNSTFATDAVSGAKMNGDITDKRGYAERWHFSPRLIDNLLAQGLPHLKIGTRRVRILVEEADAWMRERFGTQRRGPVSRTSGPGPEEGAK